MCVANDRTCTLKGFFCRLLAGRGYKSRLISNPATKLRPEARFATAQALLSLERVVRLSRVLRVQAMIGCFQAQCIDARGSTMTSGIGACHLPKDVSTYGIQ